MLDKIPGWLWNKRWPLNWKKLYVWFGDTLQKVGIGGTVLGLFGDAISGLFTGICLLLLSAFITLTTPGSCNVACMDNLRMLWSIFGSGRAFLQSHDQLWRKARQTD